MMAAVEAAGFAQSMAFVMGQAVDFVAPNVTKSPDRASVFSMCSRCALRRPWSLWIVMRWVGFVRSMGARVKRNVCIPDGFASAGQISDAQT